MLDAFTCAGAEQFDATWPTRQGEKANFRRRVPAESVRTFLPRHLTSAEKRELNLILRPVSCRAVFISSMT